MSVYGMTPHGKRIVRCGCNDLFDPHDEGTECFEDTTPCSECGKYPWYRIEVARGGKRQTREKERQ